MSVPVRWTGGWPAYRDAQLIELWAAGHSTAEIGRRMGSTKNSIVGRAHRLNLPGRPSPISFKGIRKRKASVKRAAKITLIAAVVEPLPTLESVAEVVSKPVHAYVGRVGECQWPLTNSRPWNFCCEPTSAGRSYCAEHVARASARTSKVADAA